MFIVSKKEELKKRRLEMFYLYEDLSEVTGIPADVIEIIEKGQCGYFVNIALKIANALDCEFDELFEYI